MNVAREHEELLAIAQLAPGASLRRLRDLQAATPAFGYCAGCGEPMALDPDGYGPCATCEQTLGKGAVAWSAK